MEKNQQQKVGAGILTLSIIQFVFSGFAMIGYLSFFAMKDTISSMPGIPKTATSTMVISMIFTIITVISIILILLKKELGVFIYFIAEVASLVYSIVVSGFSPLMIVSLIIPILMAIFVWKKREVFGIGTKAEGVSINS